MSVNCNLILCLFGLELKDTSEAEGIADVHRGASSKAHVLHGLCNDSGHPAERHGPGKSEGAA